MKYYYDKNGYLLNNMLDTKPNQTISKEFMDMVKNIRDIPVLSDEDIDNAVVKEYENVGDEKLFPNHTDKDIWMNGFYEGAKWYREQIKNK
jgi:hypothetical protein